MAKYDSGSRFDTPGLRYADDQTRQLTGTAMSEMKYDIRGLAPDAVIAKIRVSINGCTNNPDIPGATTQVTEATSACQAVDDALAKIADLENQLKQARIDRDSAVAEAVLKWKLLGNKVQEVTRGNSGQMIKAGFEVASGPTTRPMPGQVQNLYAEATKKAGEARLKHDRDKNAASYEYQTSPDPITDSSWTHRLTSSKSRNVLAGLPATAKLWVRARAIKGDYQAPWSDPALTSVS